ncbi:hypothetical protein CJ030_MR3G018976 [Morella rubra]|uniref:Uncharacterized protein n=1 Tax=Morella rubra TaxID=262757 RepID=A0A6A1W6Y5_9ROSI|nr:hypothetical protein CJ030_MR3G018976 [Morella rubra]
MNFNASLGIIGFTTTSAFYKFKNPQEQNNNSYSSPSPTHTYRLQVYAFVGRERGS